MRADSAEHMEAGQRSLWTEALIGVPAVNAEQWARAPGLLRWLIATRASVLPLTLFSVLFAVCLAKPGSASGWVLAALVLAAMLLAHATNNLINDYVDHRRGLDRNNYFRTQYGVHLLESGVSDVRSFMRRLVGTGVSALLLGLVVCLLVGGWAYGFAMAGALLVLFYTYPLKHWALGELAVFAAWGPLTVGGTYYCITGALGADILWAGVAYGLGPTVVIFAKHTDKADQDRDKGVLTLPVVLQPLLGRAGVRFLLPLLGLAQLTGAVWYGLWFGTYGMLGALLGLPALLKLAAVATRPRPVSCPADYPAQAWPLWYTTHAFVYARNTGAGMLLGVATTLTAQLLSV